LICIRSNGVLWILLNLAGSEIHPTMMLSDQSKVVRHQFHFVSQCISSSNYKFSMVYVVV
jgi:hypothetical protein